MVSVKNKYSFTISGLNIRNVDIKYKLLSSPTTESCKKSQTIVKNITKITDLTNKSSLSNITFLGTSKQVHKCNISMIDFSSRSDVNMLKYHCFWCKNPFNNMPIGCPISHKPSKNVRTYTSVITQNEYTIQEPVINTDVSDTAYYQTDGVFCSFNCCVAYINDNKHNPIYNNSIMLLLNMYNDMFDRKIRHIPAAPDWRMITQYGGHMNITEFRESFDKVEYQNQGVLRDISNKMSSSVTLYEPRLKF